MFHSYQTTNYSDLTLALIGLGEDFFIFGNYCRSLIVHKETKKKNMFTHRVTAEHRLHS